MAARLRARRLVGHADLQHVDDRAGQPRRHLQRRDLAGGADAGGFRVVVTQDFWYLARFWHQFGNSFYRRPDGDVPDVAHRLAGQLHGRADASAQRLDADQCGADDLCDPGVVPGDPDLSDHADLRADEQPLVGDPGADDVRHAVCDLHLLAVRQVDPDGTRRVGAHRWRQPVADLFPDLPAADGAGAGCRRHLCAAAGVERVSVQLPAAVHAGEHDRGGRAGAVPQQRRIAVELHDGDRDHLRAAADHPVLRVPSLHGGRPDHGWRQGVTRGAAAARGGVTMSSTQQALGFGRPVGGQPVVAAALARRPARLGHHLGDRLLRALCGGVRSPSSSIRSSTGSGWAAIRRSTPICSPIRAI